MRERGPFHLKPWKKHVFSTQGRSKGCGGTPASLKTVVSPGRGARFGESQEGRLPF